MQDMHVPRQPAAQKIRRWSALLVIPLGASLVLSGCSKSGQAAAGGDSTSTGPAGAVNLNTANCPADASKPLASGADIVIGTSTAMSGPAASASAVLAGVTAYFAKINAQGGIDGHKIKLVAKDDQFDTSRQVSNVTALIQQDHVFATLGDLGGAQTTATQPIQEKYCVPQLFVSSGAANFYDPSAHPWSTSGFLPYPAWGQAVVKYLDKKYPSGAKVGELVWASDVGKASADAFGNAIKGTKISIVSKQSHSSTAVSLTNQATALLAKKPDVLVASTGGTFCSQIVTAARRAGFTGPIFQPLACRDTQAFYVPLGALATNTLNVLSEIDPGVSANAKDPGVQTYLSAMKKYSPTANAKSVYTASAYRSAAMLVEQLQRAAKAKGGLTRINLMHAVWTTDAATPMSLPGVKTVISATHPYPIGAGELLLWNAAKKSWTHTGIQVSAGSN